MTNHPNLSLPLTPKPTGAHSVVILDLNTLTAATRQHQTLLSAWSPARGQAGLNDDSYREEPGVTTGRGGVTEVEPRGWKCYDQTTPFAPIFRWSLDVPGLAPGLLANGAEVLRSTRSSVRLIAPSKLPRQERKSQYPGYGSTHS